MIFSFQRGIILVLIGVLASTLAAAQQGVVLRRTIVQSIQARPAQRFFLAAYKEGVGEQELALRHFLLPLQRGRLQESPRPEVFEQAIEISEGRVVLIYSGVDPEFQLRSRSVQRDFLSQQIAVPQALPERALSEGASADAVLYVDRDQRPRVVSVYDLLRLPADHSFRAGATMSLGQSVSVQGAAYVCMPRSPFWNGRWCYGVSALADQVDGTRPEGVVQGLITLGQPN